VPARRRLPAPLRARHDSLVSAFLAEKTSSAVNGLEVTDEIAQRSRRWLSASCLAAAGTTNHCTPCSSTLRRSGSRTKSRTRPPSSRSAGACSREKRGVEPHHPFLGRRARGPRYPGEGYNVRAARIRALTRYGRARARRTAPTAPTAGSGHRRLGWDLAANSIRCWMQGTAASTRSSIHTRPRTRPSSLPFATEDFFERSAELKAAHPRLYALLQEFYALDRAACKRPSSDHLSGGCGRPAVLRRGDREPERRLPSVCEFD